MFSALFKNSEEYRLRTRLQGSTGPINCLAFTADGKLLASGGDDESIRIWDIEGKTILQVLTDQLGRWGQITCMKWISDGNTLCFGTGRGLVLIYQRGKDLKSFRELSNTGVFPFNEPVESLDYDRYKSRLVVSSHSCKVKMFQVERNGTLISVWQKETVDNTIPRCVRFIGKGEHIIIFGLESGVMISKLAATGADNWIKNLKTSVGGACLSVDQNLLLVDNLVKGFDVYSYPHTSPSDSFTIKRGKTYLQDGVFLEDGSSIGCGSDHGKIYLYSLETTKCVQTLKHGSKITMVQALDACSNNNYHLIASGTTEKRPKIHIWEKSSGPKRQRERDHGCNWVFLLVILNLSVLVVVVVALAGDEGQQYLLQGSKFFTVEGGFRALPTVVVQPRHSEPSELKKLSDAVYQRAKEGMMKRGVDLEDPEWRQRLEESL